MTEGTTVGQGHLLKPAGAPDDAIQDVLAEVWRHTRPILSERIAAVELATRELSKKPSDAALIDAGRGEAHKLAGVLGTFGLSRGTVLARDLEEHLSCSPAGEEGQRLEAVAAELRALVEGASAS